jgi:hypothetical protein
MFTDRDVPESPCRPREQQAVCAQVSVQQGEGTLDQRDENRSPRDESPADVVRLRLRGVIKHSENLSIGFGLAQVFYIGNVR